MISSLTARIAALGAIVMVAVVALDLLLVDASARASESFRWVTHSAEVIETMGDAMVELRDAESGQRGFVLTRNPQFAERFGQRIAESREAITRIVALTADNAAQNARAREIRTLMEQRARVLRETLELARGGDFDAAEQIIASGRGLDLMTTVSLRAQAFLDQERALQRDRLGAARDRLERTRDVALIGGPIVALLMLLVAIFIVGRIRLPIRRMREAMAALGAGDREARITDDMGSREFAQLARGYNAMADRLVEAVTDQRRSEADLQQANEALLRNSDILRDRGDVIELLGGMAHRMQAARTDDELAQIIRVFVPRVLPGIPGALYAHNNSRNLLVPIAGWGGFEAERDGFAPDQCWALRRGQSHRVAAPGQDIVCGHVRDDAQIYHCEPLLAGGEVIGTLFLKGTIDAERRFRLTALAENIASALVNHRLQRNLREQTIRDPLTGLFNRRYMEETLAIEIARSARSGLPLSLVMGDVDHFKRFNDEFGHDAGDAVLHTVAGELRRQMREGDVVCRFGGEEFTIIAPGTTAEALADRIELVRQAITEISLRHAGRTLGTTSMSFGITTWEKGMDRAGSSLIQAADAALYRAKREGRNRAVVDLRKAA